MEFNLTPQSIKPKVLTNNSSQTYISHHAANTPYKSRLENFILKISSIMLRITNSKHALLLKLPEIKIWSQKKYNLLFNFVGRIIDT